MNNSCESCPKYHVNENNFEEDIKSSTDTDKSDSSNNENHSIKYYTWMMITRKSSKVTALLPFSDVLETVMEKISELKYHPFVRNEHYKICNNLKLQMPENAILRHVDYAEI